jgi:hypothetical protein
MGNQPDPAASSEITPIIPNLWAKPSRLPDIYYNQVLNNIAAFVANPGALPHFAYAGAGTTQVQRTAGSGSTIGSTGTAAAFFFSNLSFTPNASQVISESWSTVPSVEPDELYLMRCVYQRTVGTCSAECEETLFQFFGPNHVGLPAMRPGWYCVGSKHDVPKHAAYVGRYDDTYVWVNTERVDYLTRLAIAMVDVATADVAELSKRTTQEDPTKRKIQQLQDRITFLSNTLSDYPQPLTEAAHQLQRELDRNVLALLGLTGGLNPQQFISEYTKSRNIGAEEAGQLLEDAKILAEQPPVPPQLPQGPVPPRQRRQPIAPFFPPLQPLGDAP